MLYEGCIVVIPNAKAVQVVDQVSLHCVFYGSAEVPEEEFALCANAIHTAEDSPAPAPSPNHRPSESRNAYLFTHTSSRRFRPDAYAISLSGS